MDNTLDLDTTIFFIIFLLTNKYNLCIFAPLHQYSANKNVYF